MCCTPSRNSKRHLPRRATRLTVWPRWPSRAKAVRLLLFPKQDTRGLARVQLLPRRYLEDPDDLEKACAADCRYTTVSSAMHLSRTSALCPLPTPTVTPRSSSSPLIAIRSASCTIRKISGLAGHPCLTPLETPLSPPYFENETRSRPATSY